MNVESLVAKGRRAFGGLMQDACTVTRTSGRGAFDQTTGTRAPVAAVTIYAGPCSVKAPKTVARDVEAGERDVTIRRFEVSLPFDDADDPIEHGDVVTVTAVAEWGDPWLVGRPFRVSAVSYSSLSTARKLTMEEQT